MFCLYRFASFYETALADSTLQYLIAFLVLLSTLKLWRLLRLNPKMNVFTATLQRAWSDITGFLLIIVIMFAAYSTVVSVYIYLSHNSKKKKRAFRETSKTLNADPRICGCSMDYSYVFTSLTCSCARNNHPLWIKHAENSPPQLFRTVMYVFYETFQSSVMYGWQLSSYRTVGRALLSVISLQIGIFNYEEVLIFIHCFDCPGSFCAEASMFARF